MRLAFALPAVFLAACSGNDAEWTLEHSTEFALSGLWGTSATDIYAVGGNLDEAAVVHFDGTDWRPMEAPDLPMLVWTIGFAPDDLYTVGFGGGFAHYDGTDWTTIETGTTTDLWGIFGHRSDDLWIVGGDPDEGEALILHYDGETLTETRLPSDGNHRFAHALFKVFGVDDQLYAVGQNGLIVEHVNDQWLPRSAGTGADEDFVSLWGLSADELVVVGGRSGPRIATPESDTSFYTVKPDELNALNAVTVLDDGTAILAGITGTVASMNTATGAITPEFSYSAENLHAAWTDGTTTWVVGGNFGTYATGEILMRSTP